MIDPGSGVNSFKLMKKWCGNETFTSLQSTGRYLTVLFHTDGLSDASYAGFIIKYIAVRKYLFINTVYYYSFLNKLI